MIVHLLNPENLQTLLLRLREVAEQGGAAMPEGTHERRRLLHPARAAPVHWGAFAGRHQVAIDPATAPSSAPRAAARPRWWMR